MPSLGDACDTTGAWRIEFYASIAVILIESGLVVEPVVFVFIPITKSVHGNDLFSSKKLSRQRQRA
jgi:hypothetical protein